MYNATTSEAVTSYVDSKYTVADILSSMANGDPAPNYSEPSTTSIGYTTKVPSVSTPTLTLTPTTLASLEQTFIELQSVPPVTTVAQDLSRQSGFVPPVVDPVMTKNEPMDPMDPMDYYDTSSTDSDWMPTPAKHARADNTPSVISFAGSPAGVVVSSTTGSSGRRQGGRRRRDDKFATPEEEEKRRVRRERNKVAAAKCRQRRVDQTNTLISETETLEEEKATLENEIQTLQQQKEQLEFLLEAHKPMCTHSHISKVKVKVERDAADDHCRVAVTSAHMNGIMPTITTSAQEVMTSRPTSLPLLPSRTVNITEATGVVISTPSTGVFATLGLDSMVDGHTGLTPITGAPSCGSEAQRNSSDSSSPSDTLASPTTLMAL